MVSVLAEMSFQARAFCSISAITLILQTLFSRLRSHSIYTTINASNGRDLLVSEFSLETRNV